MLEHIVDCCMWVFFDDCGCSSFSRQSFFHETRSSNQTNQWNIITQVKGDHFCKARAAYILAREQVKVADFFSCGITSSEETAFPDLMSFVCIYIYILVQAPVLLQGQIFPRQRKFWIRYCKTIFRQNNRRHQTQFTDWSFHIVIPWKDVLNSRLCIRCVTFLK